MDALSRNTPRTWFRLDRIWYMDKKYRKISHQATLLHIGLIGLAVNNGTEGFVDKEDAEIITSSLKLGDHDQLWEELMSVGLLQTESNQSKINNFDRWQLSTEERQKYQSLGSNGGKAASQSRKGKPASKPSTDGFSRDEGFLEAAKTYPVGYPENSEKMKAAYLAEVSTVEDHENVMRGINNYAEMFQHLAKTDGQAAAIKYRISFSNFMGRQEYQMWQESRLQQAEQGLAIGPPDEVLPLEEAS